MGDRFGFLLWYMACRFDGKPRDRVSVAVQLYDRGLPVTRQQLKRWDVHNALWHNHIARSRRSQEGAKP